MATSPWVQRAMRDDLPPKSYDGMAPASELQTIGGRTARCGGIHPTHGRSVRCEESRGHSGAHFHSFFMRSWED